MTTSNALGVGDDGQLHDQTPWYDALRRLLSSYEPAAERSEATDFFTTNEIVSAIEEHYGILKGISDAGPWVDGQQLLDEMQALGFRAENTGGLQMQWLLKRKPSAVKQG
jgi:hypothetical protein